MHEDQNQEDLFADFLKTANSAFEQAERTAIAFESISGKNHSAALIALGDCISLLYRAACCYWGCRGGDHDSERLIGKAVSQALSAYKLYRYCFYDESLMIVRGIGEIANLLHLFNFFPDKLSEWKTLDNRQRYSRFKPASVRKQLEDSGHLVPIDSNRYSKLCEVGTHPTPTEIPGHYTGTGIPILGMLLQPVGAYVSITELSYAISMVGVASPKLLNLNEEISNQIKTKSLELLRSLGSFNITNYDELLVKARDEYRARQS